MCGKPIEARGYDSRIKAVRISFLKAGILIGDIAEVHGFSWRAGCAAFTLLEKRSSATIMQPALHVLAV